MFTYAIISLLLFLSGNVYSEKVGFTVAELKTLPFGEIITNSIALLDDSDVVGLKWDVDQPGEWVSKLSMYSLNPLKINDEYGSYKDLWIAVGYDDKGKPFISWYSEQYRKLGWQFLEMLHNQQWCISAIERFRNEQLLKEAREVSPVKE